MNTVTLTGRLGRDPEIKDTKSGTEVCNVSLAVDSRRKGEKVTTWVPLVFFGKSAQLLAQYFGKGDGIGVVGRLSENNWTDKQGNERKSLEVIVDNLDFLPVRRDQTNEAKSQPGPHEAGDDGGGPDEADDMSVPF